MKRAISISFLAATAALCLAFPGSAQAFNTVLCENSSAPCNSPYGAGHTFKATGKMFIAAGTLEPVCISSIEFKTTAASGAPLKAEVLSYTLTSCTNHGSPCSASTILGGPFEAEMEWVPATFDVVPGAGGSGPRYKFTCGAAGCEYTVKPAHMSLHGGNPGKLVAEFALERIGGKCAEPGGTAIELEFTSPTAVWLEHT